MEFRKINITLPVQLFEKSKELIEKGLYSNFSDLVRSGIRKEIKEEQDLLGGKDEWKDLVESIRNDLRQSGLAKLPDGEILKKLKKSRDKIWEEMHA